MKPVLLAFVGLLLGALLAGCWYDRECRFDTHLLPRGLSLFTTDDDRAREVEMWIDEEGTTVEITLITNKGEATVITATGSVTVY